MIFLFRSGPHPFEGVTEILPLPSQRHPSKMFAKRGRTFPPRPVAAGVVHKTDGLVGRCLGSRTAATKSRTPPERPRITRLSRNRFRLATPLLRRRHRPAVRSAANARESSPASSFLRCVRPLGQLGKKMQSLRGGRGAPGIPRGCGPRCSPWRRVPETRRQADLSLCLSSHVVLLHPAGSPPRFRTTSSAKPISVSTDRDHLAPPAHSISHCMPKQIPRRPRRFRRYESLSRGRFGLEMEARCPPTHCILSGRIALTTPRCPRSLCSRPVLVHADRVQIYLGRTGSESTIRITAFFLFQTSSAEPSLLSAGALRSAIRRTNSSKSFPLMRSRRRLGMILTLKHELPDSGFPSGFCR